jgi:hypothetical protein
MDTLTPEAVRAYLTVLAQMELEDKAWNSPDRNLPAILWYLTATDAAWDTFKLHCMRLGLNASTVFDWLREQDLTHRVLTLPSGKELDLS